MFLANSVNIAVVIVVILLVLLVIFLRFILPHIKAKKVKTGKPECRNDRCSKCH